MRLECKVKIVSPEGTQEFTAVYDQTIYEFLVYSGIQADAVHAPCGGRNLCGKCLVKASGKISVMSNNERRLLGDKAEQGWRLACMARIHGDIALFMDMPAAEDTDAFSVQMLRICFPTTTPPEELSGQANCEPVGFAIDAGTTTIAIYLYNLAQGQLIDSYSTLNPQQKYGYDVNSRIQYAQSAADGQEQMRRAILNELDLSMGRLLEKQSIAPRQVERITIVGNTCMQHIIADVDIKPLGYSPFQPLTKDSLHFTGKALGLYSAPEAIVELPGVISGFVGADTVASIVTCGLYKSEAPVLLLDIGTNIEIVLGNRSAIFTCSVSGAALEGAGLSCGCASVPGAICRVSKNKYKIINHTIQNESPIGLCGTGALDALGIMLRSGIINAEGRMLEPKEMKPSKCRMLKKTADEWVFVLDRKENIYLNQRDVHALQLSKAAVAAGIRMLFKEYGISFNDLAAVYMAGSYGFNISEKTLYTLDVLPQGIKVSPSYLQNAAGTGAGLILISPRARADAEHIATSAMSLELSASPGFHDEFINQMPFRTRKQDNNAQDENIYD